MRKNLTFLLFIFLLFRVSAQQDLTLFQFSGIPQNNLVNPALMPEDKFVIGLPFLSSVYTTYNNRAFTLDGSLLDNGTLQIDPTTLVNSMDKKNFLNAQAYDQWFLFGFRLKNHYFKIGISEKASFDFTYPKSLFDFILRGNASFLGERVDIEDLSLNAIYYREVSLGYATEINDQWQFGAHLNLLFGLANIRTQSANFSIYTDPESYDVTLNGFIEVNTSGLEELEGEATSFLTTSGNFGLGIDLGGVYKLNEKWKFSMSLVDVGYIKWKNDLKTYVNKSTSIHLTGLDIKDFVIDGDFDSDSLGNEIRDSLENEFSFEEIEKRYSSSLSPKWYGGAKFSINGKHHVYTSAMMQFYPTSTRFGLSLGYELNLNKFIGFTANYSLYNNSFSNIGLGVRLRGGPVQFYIASDSMLASFNLLSYQSIHFRFGINFLFGEIEKAPVKNNLL